MTRMPVTLTEAREEDATDHRPVQPSAIERFCASLRDAAGVRHVRFDPSAADTPTDGSSTMSFPVVGQSGQRLGVLRADLSTAGVTPETEALLGAGADVLASLAATPSGTGPAREPNAGAVAGLVGESPAMQRLRAALPKAAAAPFPVLVSGESGAGKELVARAVHSGSARKARPFVAINCAAFADGLIEADLFGHATGAFTGAVRERRGLFEEAHGGTLFLDEVAELSARAQAALLRVLQEGELRRLGENGTRRVDVRIIAATNRPLEGEVAAGRFRADLRYRLDVVRLRVPPLRTRREDIAALAVHFWADLAPRAQTRARLSSGLLRVLESRDWPGNVRELQNVLAALTVVAPATGWVTPEVLQLVPQAAAAASAPRDGTLEEARRHFDRDYVQRALTRCRRPSTAARELGLTRQGLAKLMRRLGIPSETERVRPAADL